MLPSRLNIDREYTGYFYDQRAGRVELFHRSAVRGMKGEFAIPRVARFQLSWKRAKRQRKTRRKA